MSTKGLDTQGLTDSAVLLLALGQDTAAEVFRLLQPKEVQNLGEIMARTRSTTREHVESVFARFGEQIVQQGQLVDNTSDFVRDALTKALGADKAGMLLDRILEGSEVAGIESLRWLDPGSVAELIRNEHPQIIASILVHLERDQASNILLQFADRLRADVLLRIATLDGIQPNALKELNEALSKVLSSGETANNVKLGGSKAAAEILNFMGGSVETTVLSTIREADEDLAQKIEDQMFTFDDLLGLDNKAFQALLREIQSETLVIALKGAEAPLRERIYQNMSSRAAESLRDDLENRGPVRLSDVEAQQKEILKTVRRLADEGQISLNSGGNDGYV